MKETEVIAVVFLLIMMFFMLMSLYYNYKAKDLKSKLEFYQKIFLVKKGWHATFGHYHLLSVNSGLNWYNVVDSPTGFTIEGEANSDLVSQLLGMEELTKYVKNHGPLFQSTDQNKVNAEINLLRRAGFEVKEKEE